MKIQIWQGFWSPEILKQHPTSLFVFGDNDNRMGSKGQACIRGCPNAVGIPTKKYPSFATLSYYSDDEFEENCRKIQQAVQHVVDRYEQGGYTTLIFPQDGLGTGLADLPNKAPLTFRFLNQILKDHFAVDNAKS